MVLFKKIFNDCANIIIKKKKKISLYVWIILFFFLIWKAKILIFMFFFIFNFFIIKKTILLLYKKKGCIDKRKYVDNVVWKILYSIENRKIDKHLFFFYIITYIIGININLFKIWLILYTIIYHNYKNHNVRYNHMFLKLIIKSYKDFKNEIVFLDKINIPDIKNIKIKYK